jgi:ribosomal protein L16 Arg81 hydroxylase
MRALFGSLCRAVTMTYMSPKRSEDVDLFLASGQSGFGTHFDISDNFTIQLFGERRWTVDNETHPDRSLEIMRGRHFHPAQEVTFQGPTHDVILRPGDAFYVPAYSMHRVTGVSWSVSLSLGLRSFKAIDLVEHLLDAVRGTRYLADAPVASFPEAAGEDHVQAKLDLMQRVRELLRQMEGLALATLLAPLQLPEHFSEGSSQKDEG